MFTKKEQGEGALTEEQRIGVLEEALQFNRKLLFLVLLLAVICTSIAIAFGIVRMIRPPSSYVEASQFYVLKKEVDKVNQTNEGWQKRIEELSFELNNSQAGTFKTLLMEQELSYQLHLTALKGGMRDMAHMVPGSRTWLEIYSEQMDTAIKQSKARMRKLASMQTSSDKPVEASRLDAPEPPPVVELD